VRRRVLVLAALAGLGVADSAQAAQTPRAGSPPIAPLVLPGETTIFDADRGSWIVAAKPGRRTDRLARRYRARSVFPPAGIFRVKRKRARAFAAALRSSGRLSFAEPNYRARSQESPADPLTPSAWWRQAVVNPELAPPAVDDQSPVLGVIDSAVDLTHPEFAGSRVESTGGSGVTDEHGTAVAAVAGAPANGTGITGIWPGMRIVAFAAGLSCADTVGAIYAAIEAKVAVINMSYSGQQFCYSHLVATNFAFGEGIVPVASGGNEFLEGNLPRFPASDPHIVTVAATDINGNSAYFSNENSGIDLSAPGVGIVTAVPSQFDFDGTQDGYGVVDGTSFSAPMVAATAAWVSAARDLWNDQVVGLLRQSARDLGDPGWDQRYGYGLVDVGAALVAPAGSHDPGEPNDDLEWVNGRRFEADPPIFRSQRRRALRARLDQWEDPADVYRVIFPARRSVRIRVLPAYGDPDLEVFARRARTIYSRRGRVAISQRNGRSTDTVYIRNRARRQIHGYVAVSINPAVEELDADYLLEITRLRR
jgi:subtilase family protein